MSGFRSLMLTPGVCLLAYFDTAAYSPLWLSGVGSKTPFLSKWILCGCISSLLGSGFKYSCCCLFPVFLNAQQSKDGLFISMKDYMTWVGLSNSILIWHAIRSRSCFISISGSSFICWCSATLLIYRGQINSHCLVRRQKKSHYSSSYWSKEKQAVSF